MKLSDLNPRRRRDFRAEARARMGDEADLLLDELPYSAIPDYSDVVHLLDWIDVSGWAERRTNEAAARGWDAAVRAAMRAAPYLDSIPPNPYREETTP